MKTKVAFAVVLTALAALTYGALTTDRFGWDVTVINRVQDSVDESTLGPIPDLLFWMGLKGIAGLAIGALAAILWFKGWRAEAFFTALIIIPDAFNVALREIIGRPRPTEILVRNVLGGPQGHSFPSGYALHVTLFCGFAVFLARRLMQPSGRRFLLQIFLIAYILIAGLWLLYNGRHWPSDVLGGYVYGAFYLMVLIWGYLRYTTWRRRYPRNHLPREQVPAAARPFASVLAMLY